MGVRDTASEGRVALFDSVTGFAFGPTFDSESECDAFLAFVDGASGGQDPRTIDEDAMVAYYTKFSPMFERSTA